jgi:cobalt-zinc-cadmium efflux system membrane fusion protein
VNPVVAFALLIIFTVPAAFGHGGEDHGAPAPVASLTQSPRTTAASEEFEVVAVLEDGKLLLYLDRFVSNEPVTAARVEIEGGGLDGVATESSPGVYVINAALITPAKHPLIISIDAGDSADLLSATLDVATPQADIAHVQGQGEWIAEWIVFLLAGVLALAGGGLLLLRHRKKSRGVK